MGEQPELLHRAVAAGNVDAVHALIKQGVWLDLHDQDGCGLPLNQPMVPNVHTPCARLELHTAEPHRDRAETERLPGLLLAPQHAKP